MGARQLPGDDNRTWSIRQLVPSWLLTNLIFFLYFNTILYTILYHFIRVFVIPSNKVPVEYKKSVMKWIIVRGVTKHKE